MTSEKEEFDSALGGSVVLPEQISTYQYAGAHVEEIKDLLNEIKNPLNTKLVFQSLPKSMRRRAMSHNPKRLPRRYRSAHKSQMLKAGNPQRTKRPSRKYRRKASNLLKEYIRRQRRNVWLETHIWHAKRFHMISKWGYKLAYASCDKTYRACYRASALHCLLQDISFYRCLEIKGSLDEIKIGFEKITSKDCGLSIGAKTYTTGKREGFLDLFRINEYPKGALTKVNFIWKPVLSVLEVIRTVWIFVHPSAYREVLEEIIKVFCLKSNKTVRIPINEKNSDEITAEETAKDKTSVQLKFMTKTYAYMKNFCYENRSRGITLLELKDTLNRFRLTGPLSQAILNNALKCKPILDNEPQNWFKEYFSVEQNRDNHKKQTEFWENSKGLHSPTCLISNMVLSLNIEDPRINRPSKRTKAVNDRNGIKQNSLFGEKGLSELLNRDDLCRSAIWDADLREELLKNMISTHELCNLRNKHTLVPGQKSKFEDDLQPIPVLLIQRPGSQNPHYKYLGYGCGWDIIIPSGYGMSLWLSLIMLGARAGGLREFESVNRELGQDHFLPDTISGRKESQEKYTELRMKYFQKPPNRRSNYVKLSILSPFRIPFSQLVKEWETSLEENFQFFVVRNREVLNILSNCLDRKMEFPSSLPCLKQMEKNCLIQVFIKMKTRGNPGNFALICLPTKEDLRKSMKREILFCNDPIFVEPQKKDKNEQQRKILRLEHKKLLKRLRNRRVREKRKRQETSERKVKIRKAKTFNLINGQFKKMCELWLPEKPKTIRHQCNREVFGYVNASEFSFTEATVTGVGYITLEGLKRLFKISAKRERRILVRGAKSYNYRFATIKINCQI